MYFQLEICPNLEVCMYLDNVTRPVSELLGCSLVNLSSFVQGCQLWAGSSPSQWQGCSKSAVLAPQSGSIVLPAAVDLLKSIYFKAI